MTNLNLLNPELSHERVTHVTQNEARQFDPLDLKVVCMNIKGVSDKLQIPDNVETLTCCDIIMLSETWLTQHSQRSVFNIQGFIPENYPRKDLHPKAKRGSGGILVYVRENLINNIKQVESVCDHFVVLQIEGLLNSTSYLVLTYIPPQGEGSHLCKFCDNNFMDILFELIVKYSQKGLVSVCGDLNARTGCQSDEPIQSDLECTENSYANITFPMWQDTVLPSRASMDTVSNNRGRELLYLCQSSGLRIANGRCFDDKGIGKFTFRSATGKSVNDYLLCDEMMYNSLSHFAVGEKWPDSDHHPLYFNFRTNNTVVPNNNNTQTPKETYSKFIWNDVNKTELANCLFDEIGTLHLNRFYDSIRDLDSVDNVAVKFNEYIEQACNRALKCTKGLQNQSKFPVKPWFDSECKQAKADYHKADKECGSDEEIMYLEKHYKRVKRRKKRKFNYDNFMKIQNCKNQKELWSELNKLKGKEPIDDNLSIQDFFAHFSKPPIDNSENKYEFDKRHESDMANLLKGNQDSDISFDSNEQINLIKEILNSTITASEIESALQALKKGKSPGSDGVPIDVFISIKEGLTPFLVHLFNYVFDNGSFPATWSTGIISPVPKVPLPKASDQFRRISLLPSIAKIFDTIINTRLEFIDAAFHLDDVFNGGFKKGSRTSDNLFILNGIIQKYRALGTPVYVCFVDFKRAFDCLNRLLLFSKLYQNGFSSKLLNVMIDMYSKTKSRIKWKNFLSNTFQDIFGVNQGGVTSPYLFKSFLKDLGDALDDSCGVVIFDKILKHLLWADDLFLVSTSAEKMQKQINNLGSYCKKWQLIVNTMKTKVMVFGKTSIPHDFFQLNGNTIALTDKYTYVGNEVTDCANPFSCIYESIIQKCYRSCYKIREYCQQIGQLPPSLSVHFFDTLLMPIIEYGSEIWYNATATERLSVFQRNYFRRVLHIREKTPNNGVYGDLGVYPIELRLRNNVIKYLHRIHSLPETSPVKWVYKDLVMLNDAGFSNWVTTAHKLYSEHSISQQHNLNSFFNLNYQAMKRCVKTSSQKAYRETWLTNISDLENQPKLRTYMKFKNEFKFEQYLNLHNVKVRAAIAQFRLSAHHLRIETGRHTRPYTPADKRYCLKCNVSLIEDEQHHLMQCKAFVDQRKPLMQCAALHIPNFDSLSPHDKFIEIVRSENMELLTALGNYLIISANCP